MGFGETTAEDADAGQVVLIIMDKEYGDKESLVNFNACRMRGYSV